MICMIIQFFHRLSQYALKIPPYVSMPAPVAIGVESDQIAYRYAVKIVLKLLFEPIQSETYRNAFCVNVVC